MAYIDSTVTILHADKNTMLGRPYQFYYNDVDENEWLKLRD